MKKHIIFLSSLLVFGLASCKTKKSQTSTSSSTTSTATTNNNNNNTNYNTSTGSEPKSNTVSETAVVSTTGSQSSSSSSPKKGAATDSEVVGSSNNASSSSSTLENGTVATDPKGTKNTTATENASGNPKKGAQSETSTLSGSTTSTKGTKGETKSEVVKQPTVYQAVTDQSCAVEVSFGSYGSGIDGAAMDKVMNLIDTKKVAHTSKIIGREGERRICMPLTELKENDKKDFIEQLKKIAAGGQLVSVSIR